LANPDKTDTFHLLGKGNSQVSLNHNYFGVKLSPSRPVKYLGVILDSRLTWRKHVDVKMRKAHNLLGACRMTYRVRWGLKLKVVHWLYVPIVQVTISSAMKRLSKVQRLACFRTTRTIHTTTPIGAKEAFTGHPQVDLVIQVEAR
jgi:hypothetical protein